MDELIIEHDVEKLFKKTKGKPTMSQIKKAEKGEKGEGVSDALKAGKTDIVKGAKKLGLDKPGLSAQLNKVKKRRKAQGM